MNPSEHNAERVVTMDEDFGFGLVEETAPEGDVENIVPETPQEIDYRAEYERLQQKMGTDNDVNVVKSQRDQVKNQLQQMQAALENTRRQAEAEQAQMRQALEQYQAWYVQQMPPEQQAQWQQAQQYQAQQGQWQQVVAERDALRNQLAQTQAAQMTERLKQMTIQPYVEAAQAVGLDPSELDVTNVESLQRSFNEKVKPLLGLRQPPSPPGVPNRGQPAPPQDIDTFFAGLMNGPNPQAAIERAFERARGGGVKPTDIFGMK